MTEKDIADFAESLPGAVCDYPFEGDNVSFVLRHSFSRKWFGIYMEAPADSLLRGAYGEKREKLEKFFCGRERTGVLNLKCDPVFAEILSLNYLAVLPAYHMNKRLWITVILGADMPNEQLKGLIEMSYELTASRKDAQQK